MNKIVFLFAAILISGCASTPYQMPKIEHRVQQFPQEFDLAKPIYFDLATVQGSDNESTESENKESRKKEIQTGIVSTFGTIFYLPKSYWVVERISEADLCQEDREPKIPEFKKMCELTTGTQGHFRGRNQWQDWKTLSQQEILKFKFDRLLLQANGAIRIGEESSRDLPAIVSIAHPCADAKAECQVIASIPTTRTWGEVDWRSQGLNERIAKQVVWRASDYEPGPDQKNPRGFYLKYLNLTPRPPSSGVVPLPVVTNLKLANFFAENVPLLTRQKLDELDKNFRAQLLELGFDKYFGAPPTLNPGDYLFKCSTCGSDQMSNLVSADLGKEEKNTDREDLWGLLLVAYSKVEGQKRHGELKYVRISVDLPRLMKEIRVKPRKYLLSSEYEKEFQSSIVSRPSEEGSNYLRWRDDGHE